LTLPALRNVTLTILPVIAATTLLPFGKRQEARLAHVFETWLANSPHTWGFFFITGAPYRAYLFEVGARTKYWIVYTIDDRAQVVNVLRVWNASQDPNRFRA
jgi:hypothetical protein